MSVLKSLATSVALLSLGLATAAQAGETRSAAGLPRAKAHAALKRSSAAIANASDLALGAPALIAIVLASGAIIWVAADSGNSDSPGA